eukprot:g46481.t1
MRLREFFRKPQDLSSEPNETTNESRQSTRERSVVQQPKNKESNWTPPEGRCPRLDMYAQASILCTLIPDTHRLGDFHYHPRIHKANRPRRPIVSGKGTLYEKLSGYIEGILKPIATPQIPHSNSAPTDQLTMAYSLESVSSLDTCISIKDGHLSTSLHHKPMDNLMMLHFSKFHPKHIKKAIPYRQALRVHRICSDEEERDEHLKVLKDALIRMGYGVQLIDHQFQHATARNCNDLLRKRTVDMTDRVPFVVQYFPRANNLHRVLHSLQHVINDNEHLTKIFPTPPLLTFKQPPKLKQTIVHSKLPSLQDNIDHITTQPCHGNLCQTGKDAEAWYIGETMQTLRQQMNGHRTTNRQTGIFPPSQGTLEQSRTFSLRSSAYFTKESRNSRVTGKGWDKKEIGC